MTAAGEAKAGAPLSMRVATIMEAARDTRLIRLEPVAGGPLPSAEPGAHVGIVLPNGLVRQYSLIEADVSPQSYLLGVKRDPASRGGSAYLCEKLAVNDMLEVGPPINHFPLVDNYEPAIFVAGGIGITPIWSMIQRRRAQDRSWHLIYICRSAEDALFGIALGPDRNVELILTAEHGRPDLRALLDNYPRESHLYCCGPNSMLAAFEEASADRPSDNIHIECFTPRQAAATEGGFTVELARHGGSFFVPCGKTILETLTEAGIATAHSCLEGVCGKCETRFLEGIPDHRDSLLSERERQEGDTIMICCSGAKSERLILDL